MGDKFLEAGQIINTHGVRGEIKIRPWADSPGFLAGFERLYINGAPIKLLSARVHKGCVIASLDGVADFDSAAKLINEIVFIDRDDARLEEGRHFIADLIGLRAIDSGTGGDLGTVTDVLTLPSSDVYVIKGPREILVPAVPEFVSEVNTERGFITLRLIEGM